MLGADDVSLSNTTNGTFADKNVGTGKLVSIGEHLNGADAANYILANPIVSANIGIITPRTLNVSLLAPVSKAYDGATTAVLVAANYRLGNLVAGDLVGVDAASTTYDTATVGDHKRVTANDLTLSGPDGGNYQPAATNISAVVGVITAN